MSYLDALRQASEQQKAAEIAENARIAKLHSRFVQEVKPALERLFAGINELVQHLSYLKAKTSTLYQIKGCAKPVALFQQDYVLTEFRDLKRLSQSNNYNTTKATLDEIVQESDFALYFKCVGERSIRFEISQPVETHLQRSYLEEFNLGFSLREQLNDQGVVLKTLFIIEALIPIEFRFTCDLENSTIDLKITNFNELGEKTYTIKPAEVDNRFIDELAKYVSRQPNKLVLNLRPVSYGKLPVRAKKTMTPAAPVIEKKAPPPTKKPEQDLAEFQQWLQAQEQKRVAEQEASVKAPKGFLGAFIDKMGLRKNK